MPIHRPARVALVALLPTLLPATALAQASGVVLDAATQLPIPGAMVSLQASAESVLADEQGSYALPLVNGEVHLVAAAKGYFNAGQIVVAPVEGLAFSLEPVPADDDPAYAFPAPSKCAMCHPQQFADWAGSPMAHAGTNTWVYDTYDGTGTPGGMGGFVYTVDSPHATSNPASECRSCHQPEPWVLDLYSPLGPIDALSPESLHGVSCVVCHQIADFDESKPSFPGMWPGVVTFRKPHASEPVMFGSLGDVDYTLGGQMRASYQPQLPSAVCAACHQDNNDPDMDGDFEEPNGVVSEPTYLEWLDSPYSDPASPQYATCAGCHMPPVNSPAACAMLPDMNRPLGDVRRHTFEGTSAAFLDNAVSIAVEASEAGGAIAATVTIDNDRTGHHVPTGVTIRNAILLVEAYRASDGSPLAPTGDQVVHDLGGVGDPAQGYFGGLPGKLYAKVNHDENGEGPTFFTDATGITFDTRIPALAKDITQYTFDPPQSGGEVVVRARLIYRRSWRALVDAKGWTLDGHGHPLEDLAAPHFGHLMGEATALVDTGGGGPGGGGSGGAGGAAGTGGQGAQAGSGGNGGGGNGGGGAGNGGGGNEPPPEGGCGCRAAGAPSNGGLAAAVGLALIAWRRRRGRRVD